MLPETLALMGLIDAHRPALMASLHNAELGGVHHYLGRAEPGLDPTLQQIPARLGLPLHQGEPEAPWVPRRTPGRGARMSGPGAHPRPAARRSGGQADGLPFTRPALRSARGAPARSSSLQSSFTS